MALAQTQALLARLFTDARLRRAFFHDAVGVAKDFGLDDDDARRVATIDRREVEDFAKSLLGKRALDARKTLPLTARALGARFDALLFEAIEGPPAPGRHRADAAALTRRLVALSARGEAQPAWIVDLARYELAFVTAARPGAVLLFRRFHYPVATIAARLLAGAAIDVSPRMTFGLWMRSPGGRLHVRML